MPDEFCAFRICHPEQKNSADTMPSRIAGALNLRSALLAAKDTRSQKTIVEIPMRSSFSVGNCIKRRNMRLCAK